MHTLRAWSATRSSRRPMFTSGSTISATIFCSRSASMVSVLSFPRSASTAGSTRMTPLASVGSCRTKASIESWSIGIASRAISTIRSLSDPGGGGRLLRPRTWRAMLSA